MDRVRAKELLEPANWLTVIRLPLAALLWVAPGDRYWLLSMLAAAAISDMLDGRVARLLRARRLERGDEPEAVGRSHAVGAWLDPLCDKTFVLSGLGAVLVGFAPPLWMLLALAAREIVIIPFALAYRLSPRLQHTFRFDFRAGFLGKLATVAQFCAVVCLLYDVAFLSLIVLTTAAIGVAAAVFYLRKAVHMARWLATNHFAYARWLELQSKLGRGP